MEVLPKLKARLEKDRSDEQHDEIRTTYGEIEEIIDPLERCFKKFKNFDLIPYPPAYDHYFFCKKPSTSIDRRSNLFKTIQIEWEILRLFLPDSIYVRAYESRPDLMRAMMVAPKGTPYSHGLFCFDICFPENYPAQPPELFFHSYGQSLNPNLSKNGKVNMSAVLQSNPNQGRLKILQVLTSIQQTVLTIKNGGGGDRYKEEDCFRLTSETMLRILRSPPGNFEDFVRGYFRTRAHNILLNYKSQMVSDERLRFLNYKSQMGSDERLRFLFFKLVSAFEANGTYCKHHYNEKEHRRELEKVDENLYGMRADWFGLVSNLGNPYLSDSGSRGYLHFS